MIIMDNKMEQEKITSEFPLKEGVIKVLDKMGLPYIIETLEGGYGMSGIRVDHRFVVKLPRKPREKFTDYFKSQEYLIPVSEVITNVNRQLGRKPVTQDESLVNYMVNLPKELATPVKSLDILDIKFI